MYFSLIARISFVAVIILLAGCFNQNSTPEPSFKNSLFQSSYYVERYGQIVGKQQTQYLSDLKKRLLTERVKAIDPDLDFKIVLLDTTKPMAFSAGHGYILISKGLVNSFKTEAELAFALSHEMSHIYLKHSIDQKDMPEDDFAETNEKYELEADYMAVGVMAFAGYNPYYAAEALKNTYTKGKLNLIEVKGYPALESRIASINKQIMGSGWTPPGTIDRRDFQIFRKSLQ